jgi:hypothetical protein
MRARCFAILLGYALEEVIDLGYPEHFTVQNERPLGTFRIVCKEEFHETR